MGHTDSQIVETKLPWWRGLDRIHWFVFTVVVLGWVLDCFDQQIFNAARIPALYKLLNTTDKDLVTLYGGYAMSIFLLGWATGGLLFGVLGDKIGRAKTMALTILLYSIFTGLSAFSKGFADFAVYRFLTGLGVGGEFAVGVALLAETMPERARPYALGMLQALTTLGSIAAALVSMATGYLEQIGTIAPGWGWRVMFLVGALPALLVIPIRLKLKDPERWKLAAAHADGTHRLGSLSELFSPALRRSAVVGLLLAAVGVVGLWGILYFMLDLVRAVLHETFLKEGVDPATIPGRLTTWVGITIITMNVGGFFGLYSIGPLAQRIGRKPTFAISFTFTLLGTAAGFWFFRERSQVFWLIPLMGACQFSLFAGYAIYLPELFPTRLRSTGVSFCYNAGRFLAALGPLTLGVLTQQVYKDFGGHMPLRYAGLTMCSVFLLGLLVLPFAPETRGKPLPE